MRQTIKSKQCKQTEINYLLFVCTDFHPHARTFMYAKLCVHKTVTVGTNLDHLIYNMLIDILFPMFWHRLTLKISDKDMLNTKGFL